MGDTSMNANASSFVYRYKSTRNIWIVLMTASTLLWTGVTVAGVVESTSTSSTLIGAPITGLIAVLSCFHAARFRRTRIEIDRGEVSLFRVYKDVSLPLDDVIDFELATGRFGIYTFFSVRTSEGKVIHSSLQPAQNIFRAAKLPKVQELLSELNTTLKSVKSSNPKLGTADGLDSPRP
jgi:hypothetical protein